MHREETEAPASKRFRPERLTRILKPLRHEGCEAQLLLCYWCTCLRCSFRVCEPGRSHGSTRPQSLSQSPRSLSEETGKHTRETLKCLSLPIASSNSSMMHGITWKCFLALFAVVTLLFPLFGTSFQKEASGQVWSEVGWRESNSAEPVLPRCAEHPCGPSFSAASGVRVRGSKRLKFTPFLYFPKSIREVFSTFSLGEKSTQDTGQRICLHRSQT